MIAPGGPARRPVVALVGALDTKGAEYDYLRKRLEEAGVSAALLDVGVLGAERTDVQVDRRAVAAAAGADLDALVAGGDRGGAVTAMAQGAAAVVARMHAQGLLDGLLVAGGSGAAHVMSRCAEQLPLGCPKVLVSTVVAGDTRPYVGTTDLTMMHSVVDLTGVDSISAVVLARAADACAGMVLGAAVPPPDGAVPAAVVACSVLGVTTAGVVSVASDLQRRGLEVHSFHANGAGGRCLEALVRSGLVTAVADLTPGELADEVCGGAFSAGPDRLEAAGERGIPQVVSIGGLDMVKFGPPQTVPERLAGRRQHVHNPAVTLVRTDAQECAALGALVAEKLGRATGPVEVHVPVGGFSELSVPGGPFHDPGADAALVEALRDGLDPRVEVHLHESDVNHPDFAAAVAAALARTIEQDDRARS